MMQQCHIVRAQRAWHWTIPLANMKVLRPAKTTVRKAAISSCHSWRAATKAGYYQNCHWQKLPEASAASAVRAAVLFHVALSNIAFNFRIYNFSGNIDQRTTHVRTSLNINAFQYTLTSLIGELVL